MSEIADDLDLDRRLAVQIERAKVRHVESMEETDRWHQRWKLQRQREDLWRQRYERFKWLVWGVGAIAFVLISAGGGLLMGDFLKSLSKPNTVIIQLQPAPTQGPGNQSVSPR